jgi:ribose transport system substrate-binding protein
VGLAIEAVNRFECYALTTLDQASTLRRRAAIIAALHVLKGEPVPGPIWDLPDPAITQADLDKYVNPKLPPLHYAMCGCENMPGYPQRWGGK